jgi:hypothetical protein
MTMKASLRLASALMALIPAASAFAHGGGLDKNGCHMNRKTGEYHCHRAAAALSANATGKSGAVVDGTCYTGPRGGRYRIVNGSKRYGC